MKKIQKLLIANRAEIALRVQKTCERLSIRTVSIASEADKHSLAARKAQELVIIGPAAPKNSYLCIAKIIEVAKAKGCDAVHPGYGFLSENADFARAVLQAGLIFVGPEPESIALMGQKTKAKQIVQEYGVPCAASTGALDDKGLIQESEKVGFPLLIKAVAGGGGRGMRIMRSLSELKENLPRARAEAKKNFASEEVFLEKYIDRPRHVEVQVFGDSHGNLIHLGTRDCSTQRRHQKILEEAPAPYIEADVREAMHQAALKAAKSVNYKSAGTVEFLLKGKEFFFLEMNTRIQVEHPVTEAITKIDLVELQLKIAQGEKLPLSQAEVSFEGHAIEFRLNAEDATKKFAPAVGRITKLRRPDPWPSSFREDCGYEEGDEISLFYDGLISKLIIRGENRHQAIEESRVILRDYQLEGLPNTLAYHRWLLYNQLFTNGPVDIGFVERELPQEAELRALQLRDPAWKPARGGALVKSLYQYTSKKFKTTYTIEILHRRDGFFVAAPVDKSGKSAKNQNCRMSNGLNAAINSLIDDVLETTPPAEIFN